MNVRDAESDVVHDAEQAVIGVCRHVEHVFDPVGAVGDLHVDPIRFVVFSSAVPIDVEAEDVFVEFVFCIAVMHNKSGMNKVPTYTAVRVTLANYASFVLHKPDWMTFWIDDVKP